MNKEFMNEEILEKENRTIEELADEIKKIDTYDNIANKIKNLLKEEKNAQKKDNFNEIKRITKRLLNYRHRLEYNCSLLSSISDEELNYLPKSMQAFVETNRRDYLLNMNYIFGASNKPTFNHEERGIIVKAKKRIGSMANGMYNLFIQHPKKVIATVIMGITTAALLAGAAFKTEEKNSNSSKKDEIAAEETTTEEKIDEKINFEDDKYKYSSTYGPENYTEDDFEDEVAMEEKAEKADEKIEEKSEEKVDTTTKKESKSNNSSTTFKEKPVITGEKVSDNKDNSNKKKKKKSTTKSNKKNKSKKKIKGVIKEKVRKLTTKKSTTKKDDSSVIDSKDNKKVENSSTTHIDSETGNIITEIVEVNPTTGEVYNQNFAETPKQEDDPNTPADIDDSDVIYYDKDGNQVSSEDEAVTTDSVIKYYEEVKAQLLEEKAQQEKEQQVQQEEQQQEEEKTLTLSDTQSM